MNTQPVSHNNKKDGSEIFPTVFTVPINKPFMVTKEEYEEMMKNAPKPPSTRKELAEKREEARKRAEKLFKKPEKKQDE